MIRGNPTGLLLSLTYDHSEFQNDQTASLSFSGKATKITKRSFNATLTLLSSAPRIFIKLVTGLLSFTGSDSWLTKYGLRSNLSFTGSDSWLTKYGLRSSLSFTGSIKTGKIYFVVVSAIISFSGSLKKTIIKVFVTSLTFTTGMKRFIKTSFKSNLGLISRLTGWIVPKFSLISLIIGSQPQQATQNEITVKEVGSSATISGIDTDDTKESLREE